MAMQREEPDIHTVEKYSKTTTRVCTQTSGNKKKIIEFNHFNWFYKNDKFYFPKKNVKKSSWVYNPIEKKITHPFNGYLSVDSFLRGTETANHRKNERESRSPSHATTLLLHTRVRHCSKIHILKIYLSLYIYILFLRAG